MSNQSKQEYVARMKERYCKCFKRVDKSILINEMMDVLKMNRKSVLRLLHKKKRNREVFKGRKIKYNGKLTRPLSIIWKALGCPCSKRLTAQIPEMITVLERFNELPLLTGERKLLLSMSNFTVNKLLKSERKDPDYYGLSGTKTSPLLKTLIPIRTGFEDVKEPGHTEMDCVLHCGTSPSGQYAQTLNILDIDTHWNEKSMFLNKTRGKVVGEFDKLKKQFPFQTLSIDFDNGTEFVNWVLYGYCKRKNIAFTRSRSYHKNDQAHIEGKNYHGIRKLIGYERIDSPLVVELVNDIYRNEHRLLTNFFYPTSKLETKKRIGTKIKRTHSIPETPYQRILKSPTIFKETKEELTCLYLTLNPLQLQRSLHQKLMRIKKLLGNTNYLATTKEKKLIR